MVDLLQPRPLSSKEYGRRLLAGVLQDIMTANRPGIGEGAPRRGQVELHSLGLGQFFDHGAPCK